MRDLWILTLLIYYKETVSLTVYSMLFGPGFTGRTSHFIENSRNVGQRRKICLCFQVVLVICVWNQSWFQHSALLLLNTDRTSVLSKEQSISWALMLAEALSTSRVQIKNRSVAGSLLRKCVPSTAYERLSFQATISSGLFHYALWKPQYWGLNKSLFVSVPCCESILCLRVICSIRPLNMNILQCLNITTLGFPFNTEFSVCMIHDRYFIFAIFP